MVQIGFLARRDTQRDVGHRASVATPSRKPEKPVKAAPISLKGL